MVRISFGYLVAAAVMMAAVWGSSSAWGDGVFTLAVVPDTQMEVLDPKDKRLQDRLRWIVSQREALGIAMVLHVGDLVNWDTPAHAQFEIASNAFGVLDEAKLPYAIALGNHDTAAVKVGGSAAPGNVNLNLRNTSTFNQYFPAARFIRLAESYEGGKVDNAAHTFSAGGLDWLVINLELWARPEPIAWARGVIAAHPHHNVILLTHSHTDGRDAILRSNGGYGDSSAQHVFDELAKPFANVKLIFSGHHGSHGYRKDDGAEGNVIHQFRQCYHDRNTNPVRLIQIDTKRGTITSRVHCPSVGRDKQDGSAMTIEGVNWIQLARASD